MSRKWDYIAKLVMIGDSACGKSSLTVRLTDGRFSSLHDVTIAAEIGSKVVPVGDNQHIKLQIWDTAGQEHFRSVTRSYFRNAAGCILVYDITRRETFDHVAQWLEDIKSYADENITIVLVGNKADETSRQVTQDEALQWALDHEVPFFIETSAKTGDNVVEAYTRVAEMIQEKIVSGQLNPNVKSHGVKASVPSTMHTLELQNPKTTSSGCC